MKTKTLLAALAVTSLAFAQPAAAATRSYESLPKSGAKVARAERTGSRVEKDEGIVLSLPLLLIAAAAAAAIAAAVAAASSNQSGG